MKAIRVHIRAPEVLNSRRDPSHQTEAGRFFCAFGGRRPIPTTLLRAGTLRHQAALPYTPGSDAAVNCRYCRAAREQGEPCDACTPRDAELTRMPNIHGRSTNRYTACRQRVHSRAVACVGFRTGTAFHAIHNFAKRGCGTFAVHGASVEWHSLRANGSSEGHDVFRHCRHRQRRSW